MPNLYLDRKFSVDTAIDVGVAQGTPWMYEEIQYNKLILVEPNQDFNEEMKLLGGTIYNVAAGAECGETVIKINLNKPRRSSMYKPVWLERTWGELEERTIPVLTLDTIMEREGISGSVFLKVDTEGHDLEVLKGATKLLSKTEAVVCEVSRWKRFEDSYKSQEVFDFMFDHGFIKSKILHTTPNWWDILFYR